MAASLYVHLSDIHFGQEKGGDYIVHNDVKERLIDDVKAFKTQNANVSAAGILVTGDIAYAGKAHEYDEAHNWLNRVDVTYARASRSRSSVLAFQVAARRLSKVVGVTTLTGVSRPATPE